MPDFQFLNPYLVGYFPSGAWGGLKHQYMKFRNFPTLIFLLFTVFVQAQFYNDTIKYSVTTNFAAGSGRTAPFLSTANQYDRYSFAPNSLAVWGSIHKEIKNSRTFDYGVGLELDGNVADKENRFFANECYIQGKFWFLNMFVGKKQEIFGNQDPELSSGGMIWSQNSRPLPKISLETNGYIDVPYSQGYLAVMGGISHGVFDDNIGIKNLLLHHKYVSIRLGGSFPLNLNYGIQHEAQWGGESKSYSMPVTWDNYFRIFLGESGGSTASMSDQINTLGKHQLSQNLGLDLNLKSMVVSLYWQNLTEDPPIKFITSTMNVQDGLWGLSVRIPTFRPLHSFVLEYISTTDHSGPWHDLDGVIYGGIDPYYLNGQVGKGWTYNGMTIGNPWLTSPKYNQNGSITILNNTVRLYYFSGKGNFNLLNYRMTMAYSENYGLAAQVYDNCKRQLSYQLETSTPLKFMTNTKVSLAISGDKGTQYGNNMALILGISWSGILGY